MYRPMAQTNLQHTFADSILYIWGNKHTVGNFRYHPCRTYDVDIFPHIFVMVAKSAMPLVLHHSVYK